jgi:hypothetical protein
LSKAQAGYLHHNGAGDEPAARRSIFMGRSFYGRTEAELYSGSKHFSSRISLDPAAYRLTQQEADDYAAANAIWVAAYEACRDPQTRNRLLVAAKNAAARTIRALSADLARIINGTPGVTDVQKLDLGLSVRTTPSRIARPTRRPLMEVLSVVGRTVTVRIHDPTRRGKPLGAAAAWVYTFMGENYPTDANQWRCEGAATRAKYSIVFPSAVPSGQQVWIRAAWVNPRQEAGPMSVPITTNLQGGGAAGAGGAESLAVMGKAA